MSVPPPPDIPHFPRSITAFAFRFFIRSADGRRERRWARQAQSAESPDGPFLELVKGSSTAPTLLHSKRLEAWQEMTRIRPQILGSMDQNDVRASCPRGGASERIALGDEKA